MPSEADFLRAVLARPDDDAPRLIMADWLDEQGQGDRAEFIRVQCRIAELQTRGVAVAIRNDYPGLLRRERELRLRLGSPFARIPLNVDCEWRRGFVEGIRCAAETCLAFLDAILQAQPVQQVTLSTWPLHEQVGGIPRWGVGYNENVRLALKDRWPSVKTWHLPPAGNVPVPDDLVDVMTHHPVRWPEDEP